MAATILCSNNIKSNSNNIDFGLYLFHPFARQLGYSSFLTHHLDMDFLVLQFHRTAAIRSTFIRYSWHPLPLSVLYLCVEVAVLVYLTHTQEKRGVNFEHFIQIWNKNWITPEIYTDLLQFNKNLYSFWSNPIFVAD